MTRLLAYLTVCLFACGDGNNNPQSPAEPVCTTQIVMINSLQVIYCRSVDLDGLRYAVDYLDENLDESLWDLIAVYHARIEYVSQFDRAGQLDGGKITVRESSHSDSRMRCWQEVFVPAHEMLHYVVLYGRAIDLTGDERSELLKQNYDHTVPGIFDGDSNVNDMTCAAVANWCGVDTDVVCGEQP